MTEPPKPRPLTDADLGVIADRLSRQKVGGDPLVTFPADDIERLIAEVERLHKLIRSLTDSPRTNEPQA